MKKYLFKDENIYDVEKKKASFNYIKLSHDLIVQRRIRFFKILFVFLIALIIRGIFGPIYIKNIFGYPSSNNRYFDVKVNGESLKDTSYKLQHNLPIIPFFLYFRSSYEDSSLYVNEPISGFYEFYGNKITVDIDSYECYYGKYRIKCKYFKDVKPEKKKIKLKLIFFFYYIF